MGYKVLDSYSWKTSTLAVEALEALVSQALKKGATLVGGVTVLHGELPADTGLNRDAPKSRQGFQAFQAVVLPDQGSD
ncbi:hypothetical protein [Paraburkholderia aspalathi]|uniref:hypothetical protein n=1 Tax=Paraburkholderia aspalathi TaxID=1324617 RepID=UPI001B0EF88A|nr:hypothetical protein [Paraburkholderia aspalathi]CAE6842194.1 hypothetical protein R20943_07165 [Paraburkholderia aspalathi]